MQNQPKISMAVSAGGCPRLPGSVRALAGAAREAARRSQQGGRTCADIEAGQESSRLQGMAASVEESVGRQEALRMPSGCTHWHRSAKSNGLKEVQLVFSRGSEFGMTWMCQSFWLFGNDFSCPVDASEVPPRELCSVRAGFSDLTIDLETSGNWKEAETKIKLCNRLTASPLVAFIQSLPRRIDGKGVFEESPLSIRIMHPARCSP